MSIFGSILSKIFGDKVPAATQASMTGLPGAATSPAAGGGATPAATPVAAQTAPTGAGSSSPAAGTGAAAPASIVDVEEVLDAMEDESDQELNWRQSIVDLMKLLKLDSSLTASKSLAQELHYTGDTKDSAAMNIWLHKQVMTKLAQNGGKVPSDLTH